MRYFILNERWGGQIKTIRLPFNLKSDILDPHRLQSCWFLEDSAFGMSSGCIL